MGHANGVCQMEQTGWQEIWEPRTARYEGCGNACRGSAMGAFVAFLDIAYGISGPAAGVIAGQFCYAVVYRFGTACALLGGALVATARNPQSS
jgi:hypothetical protein